MRFPLAILVLLATIFGALAHSEDIAPFDMDAYRKECGGQVFARCGAWFKGSDQRTIFDHARAWAKHEHKLLLVITGFEWCGPCRHDVQMFTSEERASKEVLAEVQKDYIAVAIDRDMSGSKGVIQEIGLQSYGFSEVVIFDPETNKPVQKVMFPQLLDSLHINKCHETPLGNGQVFKMTNTDFSRSAQLELLQNPGVPILDLVSSLNDELEMTCK